ncbi:MAG: PIN domain-containing protein [Spirochaetaceae bacterium]
MPFMTVPTVFVDTKVLIYAHDLDSGEKHDEAAKLILSAWNEEVRPVISVQVLQELAVNLLRKLDSADEAIRTIIDYSVWKVIETDTALVVRGTEVMKRYKLSWWDSMIVAAAEKADADILWTEDLNDGQQFGKLKVVNPLKQAGLG